MKAIIKIKGIKQFSCEINDKLSTMTSFRISKNYASASLLNALFNLGCNFMERFDRDVCVHIKNEFIESITFID